MVGSVLYASTTQRWLSVNFTTGEVECSGRKGSLGSTGAVADGLVLATCPDLTEVHGIMRAERPVLPGVSLSKAHSSSMNARAAKCVRWHTPCSNMQMHDASSPFLSSHAYRRAGHGLQGWMTVAVPLNQKPRCGHAMPRHAPYMQWRGPGDVVGYRTR